MISPLIALAFALGAPAAPSWSDVAGFPTIMSCKILDAIVKTPCAARLAVDKALPALLPIEVRNITFSKQVVQNKSKGLVAKLKKWEAAGFKKLGKLDKHLIPDTIDVDLVVGITIDKLNVTQAAGLNELKVTGHASVELKVNAAVGEHELKGKTLNVSVDLGGTLFLTNAPSGEVCAKEKIDWAMVVFAIHFDEVKNLKLSGAHHGLRVPRFITDAKTFLSIVNWTMDHAYTDYDRFHTRGISFCFTTENGKDNCLTNPNAPPAPPTPPSKATVVSLAHGMPLCGLASRVLADACAGSILNALSASIFPIRRPIPKELLGVEGVAVVARSLQTATSAAGIAATAKLALTKTGQPEFALEASGLVRVTPVCTNKSLTLPLEMHIGLTQIRGSPSFPAWLVDGVGRTAVNVKLRSHGPFVVPLRPQKIKRIDHEVNACVVARSLLKTAATDAVATSMAHALLPFDIPAGAVLADAKLSPGARRLAHALDDLSLVLKEVEARKGAGSAQKLRVAVQLRKAKQAAAFTTEANLTVDTTAECGPGKKNVLVLRPRVDHLGTSKLPAWLLGATVLDLVNTAISAPQTVCMLGECP